VNGLKRLVGQQMTAFPKQIIGQAFVDQRFVFLLAERPISFRRKKSCIGISWCRPDCAELDSEWKQQKTRAALRTGFENNWPQSHHRAPMANS
jgi:hypothetical protein